jgi:lysozyme family protein
VFDAFFNRQSKAAEDFGMFEARAPQTPKPTPEQRSGAVGDAMPEDAGRGRASISQVAQRSPGQAAQTSGSKSLSQTKKSNLFQNFRKRLGPREGGLAKRPFSSDPGGKTFKGITSRNLPGFRKAHPDLKLPKDVTQLTDHQIDEIMRREFFEGTGVPRVAAIPGMTKLAPQLPEQLFDSAVLHGAEDAGKFLQKALDDVLGSDLREINKKTGKKGYDGIVGSKTLQKIEQAVRLGKIQNVNDRMVEHRLGFIRGLRRTEANRGWGKRAEEFRNFSQVP